MTLLFDPSGMLDIASDPSDLPEEGDGINISSDSLRRCKNLRITNKGVAKTRDGSAKLNAVAISTAIWWIEEQAGTRFTFAGTAIYANEASIVTGLTSAQWSALQYNSFNDTVNNIFATNGVDRKRIQSGTAYEWGLVAPTDEPTLTAGSTGGGLTGRFSAQYTYVRKVGTTVIAESNPSPASGYIVLTNQSLLVDVTAPTDPQVTHIRLYRTDAGGAEFFRDQDIPTGQYVYGVTHTWEGDEAYLPGNFFKFASMDSAHSTDDTYTWEADPSTEANDIPDSGGSSWFAETAEYYVIYVTYVLQSGGTPLSYDDWLALYS